MSLGEDAAAMADAAPRGSGVSRLGRDTLPHGRGRASDTLGWTPLPSDVALRQVIFVLRHGERAPVRTRMQTATPPIPLRWNFCHTSHEFDKAVLRLAEGEKDGVPSRAMIQRRIEVACPGTEPAPGAPGDCLLGELTDLGRMSMLQLGRAMRRLYVDKLHFLPERLAASDEAMVYFRSTDMRRTAQSLDQVITGLMDPFLGQPGTLVPHVFIRNITEENMLPNPRTCGRLAQLMRSFAKEAAVVYNPKLAQLDESIAPHNNGKGPRVDGQPRLSGLVDTARAAAAHGIDAPAPFLDEKAMGLMEEAVVHEWFAGFANQNEQEALQYRRLATGDFFASLYGSFAHRIRLGERDPSRLRVYLGHDATLVGILHTLECFNGKWPSFGSALSMELLEKESGDGAYVRCRYGDEPLVVPGCSAPGKHYPGRPEICTLAAFREVVVDRLRHPDNVSVQEECNLLAEH